MEHGDPGRGAGFLPLDAGGGQARPAALAGPGSFPRFCGRGNGVLAVGAGAQRDGAALLLRVPPGGGHRADREPVPAGPVAPRPAGARASQPDGTAPQRAGRALPADGAVTDPAQRAGRGVQRDLRPAALAPGPGARRVLRLDRGPGLGASVGHSGRCRPGTSGDCGDPQGDPGGSGTASLDGRVRVAAPLPAGDGQADSEGAPAAAVVDVAAPVRAADLPRGAPHVRAGRRGGRQRRDAARAAAYRGLPDGRGPGTAADRRPARPRSCTAHHHADLPDSPQGGRGPPGPCSSPGAIPAGSGTGQAGPAPGYRPETLDVLFGDGTR